ncbi:Na(+)/H(+) antiporter NhaA [Thalassotalea insulae]|uniref:Na(+)/H(+) antiporter NhaA n=1 Tax=Thalassotalea insulae TaxID=2056778 RepID=A0ABQ6GSX7_9GAMM|nr:Na+/H+ antiporter NhaA [Thalassotalea insulae]GLX79053.1 Na(+)/H(+) antiporter NhaA [Thalassotalea insulae]
MKLEVHDKHREHMPLEKEFQQVISPLQEFIHHQSTAGLLLVLATIIAMVMANTTWDQAYIQLRNFNIGFIFGDFQVVHTALEWVNEALIVLFFFLLGLEIKYELLAGELKELRKSMLAIAMALGGMVAPALIYIIIMAILDGNDWQGWGIVMATDTAFALGLLVLLGARVSKSLLVLITALAIVDDMGAVLIISVFYSENVSLVSLGYGAFILLIMVLANVVGIRAVWFYLLSGILLWWFVSHSGIHATTAGILAALTVPTKPMADTHWFTASMERVLKRFRQLDRHDRTILEVQQQHDLAQAAEEISKTVTTPVQRWQSKLARPIGFIVLPLFALLNAGVKLPETTTSIVVEPVYWACLLGLVIGKPLGIFLFSYILVLLGGAEKPSDMQWKDFLALGCFAGIGFTMSLFITNLAFVGQVLTIEYAKLGIISGSILSAMLGFIMIMTNPKKIGKDEEQKENV